MSKKIMSEEAVKKALAINSFREVSKEKIVDFISMIPNMDKDVAISIINQFPAYTEFATTSITVLKDMCDMALKNNESSQKDAIAAFRKTLDDFGEILKKDNISPEERKYITNGMLLIADKISEKDTENKNFLLDVLKYGTSILGGAIIIGATILGINIKGKDIPLLKK